MNSLRVREHQRQSPVGLQQKEMVKIIKEILIFSKTICEELDFLLTVTYLSPKIDLGEKGKN